jgi:hypothetical protein
VPRAREALESQILGLDPLSKLRRLVKGKPDPRTVPALAPDAAWSPDQPVETFLALSKELGIESIDVRAALRAQYDEEKSELYYQKDWHLDPSGNRALAAIVHDELDARGVLAGDLAKKQAAAIEPYTHETAPKRWPYVYLALVVLLGTLYARTYRDVAAWKAFAIVAAMLGLVFTIALGGGHLIGKMSPAWSQLVLIAFVLTIVLFVMFKLGRRLGTIAELLLAFTRRGHWYLMPLVVILLTIGSLLVVAASSPLVAPFIYTLF